MEAPQDKKKIGKVLFFNMFLILQNQKKKNFQKVLYLAMNKQNMKEEMIQDQHSFANKSDQIVF